MTWYVGAANLLDIRFLSSFIMGKIHDFPQIALRLISNICFPRCMQSAYR